MTATRTRPYRAPEPTRSFPVVPVAVGAVLVVLAIGLAVAMAGSEDSSGGDPATVDLASFGDVTVQGTNLPGFTGAEADAAVGLEAPRLSGVAPDGIPTEVGGGPGEPTLVAFLAHWCPHCQAELPVLVDLQEDGAFDGVRTVAVLTGTDERAPNYPPAEWLIDEGWQGDVLLDSESATAATAYGLAGYPFLVVLDGDGEVVARTSGELPAEQIQALVDAAR